MILTAAPDPRNYRGAYPRKTPKRVRAMSPPLAGGGCYHKREPRMTKVVSLSVHKNNLLKRQRKKARRSLTTTANQVSRHKQIDGYALVTFTISDNGSITHGVHYDVPTASFAYVLPQMAQQALFTALTEDTLDED